MNMVIEGLEEYTLVLTLMTPLSIASQENRPLDGKHHEEAGGLAKVLMVKHRKALTFTLTRLC